MISLSLSNWIIDKSNILLVRELVKLHNQLVCIDPLLADRKYRKAVQNSCQRNHNNSKTVIIIRVDITNFDHKWIISNLDIVASVDKCENAP